MMEIGEFSPNREYVVLAHQPLNGDDPDLCEWKVCGSLESVNYWVAKYQGVYRWVSYRECSDTLCMGVLPASAAIVENPGKIQEVR